MMLTPRANFHHSKLTAPGALGHIVGLSTVDPLRKCIVSHYLLCDNVLPYSLGIHTVFVRFLDNHEIMRFSGIWFRRFFYVSSVPINSGTYEKTPLNKPKR